MVRPIDAATDGVVRVRRGECATCTECTGSGNMEDISTYTLCQEIRFAIRYEPCFPKHLGLVWLHGLFWLLSGVHTVAIFAQVLSLTVNLASFSISV